MLKTKLIPTLLLLLSLGGCGTSSYYVLSTAPQPAVTYRHLSGAIGVEKVRVPKYLFKQEIAVARSNSQVTFLNGASWVEDIDEGLTQRLISYLQKKFNQPEVYSYPWDVSSQQPRIKVKVQISRFISKGTGFISMLPFSSRTCRQVNENPDSSPPPCQAAAVLQALLMRWTKPLTGLKSRWL